MTKPGTSTAGVAPNVPVSRAVVASNSSGCCTVACQVTPFVVIIGVALLGAMERSGCRTARVGVRVVVGAGGGGASRRRRRRGARLLVEDGEELQADAAQVSQVL